MTVDLKLKGPLRGDIEVPPDKSISHRAALFGSIAEGQSIIDNYLMARDPLATLKALRSLGVNIGVEGKRVTIEGVGLQGLKEPEDVINCENSGTTMRLLSGLLAAQPFFSVLTGDHSLRKRPMDRVIIPLRMMGASLYARRGDSLPPVAIKGGALKGISYICPQASAQVKTAIILAGLYAQGETTVVEPYRSRDHTEKMLQAMGADLRVEGTAVRVRSVKKLDPIEMIVPGDFSSAAFFVVAALVVPGSDVMIRSVGVNPTRTGLLDILVRMGGEVDLMNIREAGGEPVADIHVKYRGPLRATEITPEEVPKCIDEFPILTVAATQAEGVTSVRGAQELRVKESDRIATMVAELRKMGVEVEEYSDGLSIKGPARLRGGALKTYNDHRVAMALAIASLLTDEGVRLEETSSVEVSFPGFFDLLNSLCLKN